MCLSLSEEATESAEADRLQDLDTELQLRGILRRDLVGHSSSMEGIHGSVYRSVNVT